MKSAGLLFVGGVAYLALDLRVAYAILQSSSASDVLRWGSLAFTVVSAVVGIAMSVGGARALIAANQKATEAGLSERVHLVEFRALKEQVDRQHLEIRSDIASLRDLVITAIRERSA